MRYRWGLADHRQLCHHCFLFHFRSALIAILALPIAVIVSFTPVYWLGVTSSIMSLGGIALPIGVLVDASIVMVQNGYRHLSEGQERDREPDQVQSGQRFSSMQPSRPARLS